VNRVTARTELGRALARAFELDRKVVVERGLDHPREIECAVLGNENPITSMPGEIIVHHLDGFYSYAAKYMDARGATPRVPADLTPPEVEAIRAMAFSTFRTLECEGMARVDFFLAGDHLYVNEINTIPGFTGVSMYPKLWEASGLSGRSLVSRLIDLALDRARKGHKLRSLSGGAKEDGT
jgi:D-alanine-D-alanine ligase